MRKISRLYNSVKEELVGDSLAQTEATTASILVTSAAVEFDPSLTGMQSGMLSFSFLLVAAGVSFSGALKHRKTNSQPQPVESRA